MRHLRSLVQGAVWSASQLIERAEISVPPVDPLAVGRLRRVKSIERVTMACSGALIQLPDGGYIIKLNADEPMVRQNFTAFHEIGHTFFVSPTPAMRSSAKELTKSQNREEEYLCDRIAEELLLPSKFFLPMAREGQRSVAALSGLARTFGASIKATAIRLAHSGIWGCIVIAWRPDSSGALRYHWSAKPDDMNCYIPGSTICPGGSGIYRTYLTSKPTADFEQLDCGGLKGRLYVESERFGRDVLSLVFLG